MEKKMQELRNWSKQHFVGLFAVTIFVVACVLLLGFSKNAEVFFNDNLPKSPADVLKYIGIVVGGIILFGHLWESEKRTHFTKKELLDNRFKDAAMLLNNDKTIITGIYALFQYAEDASSFTDDYKEHVRKAKEILCCLVRLKSLEGDENHQSKELIQIIVNDLFRYNHREIYNKHFTNLRKSNLSGINFHGADLRNADLRDTDLTGANLRNADLTGALLSGANFKHAVLTNAKLGGKRKNEEDLRYVDFSESKMENNDFTDTIHEGKSIDEIKAHKFLPINRLNNPY